MAEAEKDQEQRGVGPVPQRCRADSGHEHEQIDLELAGPQRCQGVAADDHARDDERGDVHRRDHRRHVGEPVEEPGRHVDGHAEERHDQLAALGQQTMFVVTVFGVVLVLALGRRLA